MNKSLASEFQVHKYAIGEDRSLIRMPVGARVLTVQMQGDNPQLWALVDVSKGTEVREFLTIGTGHTLPIPAHRLTYVNTFQILSGRLVFHVFEVEQ
jgi:hypothetical protein